ncbi:hypothetical protein ACMBCN_02350, partial [Candidatus Liberibacter asiaticus]|nr:hypothetical protein [Candidatus Liberibacter asiaticus]
KKPTKTNSLGLVHKSQIIIIRLLLDCSAVANYICRVCGSRRRVLSGDFFFISNFEILILAREREEEEEEEDGSLAPIVGRARS